MRPRLVSQQRLTLNKINRPAQADHTQSAARLTRVVQFSGVSPRVLLLDRSFPWPTIQVKQRQHLELLQLDSGGYHQLVGDDQTNQEQQYCNTPHLTRTGRDHRLAQNNNPERRRENVLILDLSSPLGDLLSNISQP